MKKEFILCAAIHYMNDAQPNVTGIDKGTVVCARRHKDCIAILNNLIPNLDESLIPPRDKQGFITSLNRYVSRTEAFKIAKENNQIWHNLFDGVNNGILASEDLYYDEQID